MNNSHLSTAQHYLRYTQTKIHVFLSDITEPQFRYQKLRDWLSLIKADIRETTAPGKARPDPEKALYTCTVLSVMLGIGFGIAWDWR